MSGGPTIVTRCVDCGLGCNVAGEWYMVNGSVWELAWRGRRKSWYSRVPGQEVLCIGCLEARIGRTLSAGDFIPDVPANDLNQRNISERMRDRLKQRRSTKRYRARRDRAAAGRTRPNDPHH
jgi:hypothetical protein